MTTPSAPPQQVPLNRRTWERFVQAVSRFARSEVGGRGLVLFGALIGLLVVINGLNVVNSYVGRDFMTAIAERSRGGFISLAFAYLGVFAASTVAAVFYRFSEERLGLLWRDWLTHRLMASYLEHPIAYRLSDRLTANGEIANPDQRIAEDVRAFTTTTLSFVLLILNGTFTAVAFSGVMWSISPLLFIVGVLYAGVGSLLTIRFGYSLVGLNYAQLDREATFRAGLVHVRENAASITAARYEGPVRTALGLHLDALIANARRIIGVNRNLGFFTTGYNYLIQIIPALIVAPMFISGQVEFGVITQAAMAFSQLLGAFSLIVTQFQSISSFTAVIARLGSLAEAIEEAQAVTLLSTEDCGHVHVVAACPICLAHSKVPRAMPTITIRESAAGLAYERLTLRSPQDGSALLTDLSVAIPPHTRVLILGDNEPAKVALFRVTAGIWETGEGRVLLPAQPGIAFLPERPYLPAGTLRQVLTPPGPATAIADASILPLIETLHLTPVVARAGGLDSEQEWATRLSLGEQQLLAVVRVVLAAPQFVFLDRPQTILSADQVAEILGLFAAHDITSITTGERNGGPHRHDAELELHADGSWQWTPPVAAGSTDRRA
ncbi:MAG: ABC transporter ATP-binding protein/permease [Candidatus Binatia bacterium]